MVTKLKNKGYRRYAEGGYVTNPNRGPMEDPLVDSYTIDRSNVNFKQSKLLQKALKDLRKGK